MKKKRRYGFPFGKKVNRKYKDRLFRFVFSKKADLLQLYNAVNGTDYQDPNMLEINTLEDGMRNPGGYFEQMPNGGAKYAAGRV